jgi:hypothetical protein
MDNSMRLSIQCRNVNRGPAAASPSREGSRGRSATVGSWRAAGTWGAISVVEGGMESWRRTGIARGGRLHRLHCIAPHYTPATLRFLNVLGHCLRRSMKILETIAWHRSHNARLLLLSRIQPSLRACLSAYDATVPDAAHLWEHRGPAAGHSAAPDNASTCRDPDRFCLERR